MNHLLGETKITLFDKEYPMKVNIGFFAKFKSETGVSFNSFAAKALAAWERAKGKEFYDRGSIMADAVDDELAAWAFFIAAKQSDKCVTFEEIQDAVLKEGVYERTVGSDVFVRSYPIALVELAVFALIDIHSKNDKKKA